MTRPAHRTGAWLLGGCALLMLVGAPLVFGCAPPPMPARLVLGKDEIRFVSAEVKFTGSGEAPVQLLFLAQEDQSRSDGRILELRLQEGPSTPQFGFAGHHYTDRNALALLHTPTPPAGTRLGYGVATTAITGLQIAVQASASGILKASGTGKALVGGSEVPVTFEIERR